jgi:thiosulfate/3-mercaptopyruvate sulfurtransferase
MAALANPGYLVSTDWLFDHLNDENLRILDVTPMLTAKLENRAREECFNNGHIPGSLFFDVPSGKGVLSDATADLPWSWPDVGQFQKTMFDYGISNDTRVVIVARSPRDGIDSGTMWCTRTWWTLHHFGVDCAILEGGIERWVSEDRPISTEDTEVSSSDAFIADDAWRRGYAGKEDVLAAIDDDSICLVDSLPESSYDGSGDGYGPRKGHITGAVNLPFRGLVNSETADFKSAGELTTFLADALARPSVVTYCGGAIAATVDAFALKLLGHHNVSVYDGSLMEWTADDSLPMTDLSA